jgi:curved DNA-binding protein CbpA
MLIQSEERSTMNYYVVLGIAEDADEETIRSAFRALARRYHPDVGAGSSPGAFQRVREAYEALADPERRRRYDRQLRDSRARPVVVRQVIVSRPFAEPLLSSRRSSFGVPRIWGTVTRSSFFDELVEELFASLDDRWFSPPRRW